MQSRIRRIGLVLPMAVLLVLGLVGPVGASGSPATYQITIQNLAVSQPLSPPVVVTHDSSVSFFKKGAKASAGIEAIAEDGDPSVAVAALTGAVGVTDVVNVGVPLTPAGSTAGGFSDNVQFMIEAVPGQRLSIAGMLICTNDGFAGNETRVPHNTTKTISLFAYDAGTERNTERSEDLVDPCSGLGPVALDGDPNGNENDAVDTDRRIRRHRGISGDADLLDAHNWSNPVGTVTIERVATYRLTIENRLSGQPISPPVVATHRPSVSLFTAGASASDAVEAIAEDGNQSLAVTALSGAGSAVYDVVDVGMPLTPRGSSAGGFSDTVVIEIQARSGDVVSLAGMLICTNDGFAGIDSARLPRSGSKTLVAKAYDAGTEHNTELSVDIVDPCSGLGPVGLNGDPNGNENDAVDSDGVIRRHSGVAGGGDLVSEHDFGHRALHVTVELVG